VTEERLRFAARLLEGEGLSEVCRHFGISRNTGYKIFNRYKAKGLDAMCDRLRRPVRDANQLPHQVEWLIVDLKRDKPYGGERIHKLDTLHRQPHMMADNLVHALCYPVVQVLPRASSV
jgi:transposase